MLSDILALLYVYKFYQQYLLKLALQCQITLHIYMSINNKYMLNIKLGPLCIINTLPSVLSL